MRRSRYPAEVDLYQQAVDLCERAGWLAGMAGALNSLGTIDSLVGRVDTALEYYDRAVPLFRTLGWVQGQASILLNRGATCLQAGRLEPARAHLTEALALFREAGKLGSWEAGKPGSREPGRGGGGAAAARRGADRLAQAVATYRRALQVAREADMPYPETRAHLGLAAAYRRLGEPRSAAAHAGQALTTARAHGYRALLGRVELSPASPRRGPRARPPASPFWVDGACRCPAGRTSRGTSRSTFHSLLQVTYAWC